MEHTKLKGQTALVTGASSGIGAGIALSLAQHGANVIVNYSSHPEPADALVAQIQAFGGQAISVHANVAVEEDVIGMFAQAVQKFGTIDILVSNAGLQKDSPFHKMTLEQWNAVIS